MIVAISLHRARRDFAVVAVWIALVAFATLLAIAGPRLQRNTVDAGARQAVAAAGSATDVLVGAHVGQDLNAPVPPVGAADILSLARKIPARLPSAVRQVYAGSELAVVGPLTRLSSSVPATTTTRPIDLQLDLLTPQNEKALAYTAGTPPTSAPTSSVVDILLSQASATASGLGVGSVAQVSTIPVGTDAAGSDTITMRVVGIVRRKSGGGDASPWRDLGTVWKPVLPRKGAVSEPIQLAVLTNVQGLELAAQQYSDTFTATLRIRLKPASFTGALESTVGSELTALAVNSSRLSHSDDGRLSVSSEYTPALVDYPVRAAAATAQISMMAAGILGAAAALILLVSNLLVVRRSADTALERARGASLPSIGLRSLAESAVFTAAGFAIGWGGALAVRAVPVIQPVLVLAVLVVALLSLPVQTVLIARPAWAGRRVPANRADRLELARGVRARRIAVELTVIALAAAALVALLARGLLESHTDGVDPLLASAPLFVAVVATILVLRVYRWPVLLAVAAGRASKGALGLLAAVRAQRSIAALPLLALTISVALAVGAGLLAGTVSTAQDEASWQRTGADVRVDAPVSPSQLALVSKTPGVTGEATYFDRRGIQLRLGSGTDFATLVAVDPGFATFLRNAPANALDSAGAASLERLARKTTASAPIPIVVDASIGREVAGSNIGMYYGHTFVPMRVVGTVSDVQAGYLGSPFVYVDRQALAARLGHAVQPSAILIDGPGAARAAHALTTDDGDIHSRAAWLAALREHAEVSGVATAITLSMISAAILAGLALVVTVLAGARERGRSLALVRTLGLPASAGNWLALAELAPVVVAALLGGIAAGVGMVALLEPVIGLVALTGGLGNPPPTFSATVLLLFAAGTVLLLVVAVVIEFSIRRRDRLSEVLRVGETT
jgi:putative ABC transport system permease protein